MRYYISDGLTAMLAHLSLSVSKCEEFANPRKYARYYKRIIKEPIQGGFTYNLRKNRYGLAYNDDITANEWTNNTLCFDVEGNNIKSMRKTFGCALWFANSLAEELFELGGGFRVLLTYSDLTDNRNPLFNNTLDSVRVSFYKKRPDFPDIIYTDSIMEDRIIANPWDCILLIEPSLV